MSTRRTVWGQWLDGSFRLRCSLNGYDALTDDSSLPDRFSFDSSWTDLVGVIAAGTGHVESTNTIIPFPDRGFVPFFDIRNRQGDTVYDEVFLYNIIGNTALITSNSLNVPKFTFGQTIDPYDFTYVIYKTGAVAP